MMEAQEGWGGGPKPRDAGSHLRLEKARTRPSLGASGSNQSPDSLILAL